MKKLNLMDKLLTLQEAADRLKMPKGSVRLGRGDTAGLTPIQFVDTPNAPIFYLVEEVYAILRDRDARIQTLTQRHRGESHAHSN